jgi:hypothetical protein
MLDPLMRKNLVRMHLGDLANESERYGLLKKAALNQSKSSRNMFLRLWAFLVSFGL